MQQNFLLVHCKDTWKSRDLRYDNTKYMPIDRNIAYAVHTLRKSGTLHFTTTHVYTILYIS